MHVVPLQQPVCKAADTQVPRTLTASENSGSMPGSTLYRAKRPPPAAMMPRGHRACTGKPSTSPISSGAALASAFFLLFIGSGGELSLTGAGTSSVMRACTFHRRLHLILHIPSQIGMLCKVAPGMLPEWQCDLVPTEATPNTIRNNSTQHVELNPDLQRLKRTFLSLGCSKVTPAYAGANVIRAATDAPTSTPAVALSSAQGTLE